jgi:hypothetical protein
MQQKTGESVQSTSPGADVEDYDVLYICMSSAGYGLHNDVLFNCHCWRAILSVYHRQGYVSDRSTESHLRS